MPGDTVPGDTEPSPSRELGELLPGASRESLIEPGARHRYSLTLQADQVVELAVEQRGIDVTTRLYDPRGNMVAMIDRPIGDFGVERWFGLAAMVGDYGLEVEAAASAPAAGGYALVVEPPRPASARDRALAHAVALFQQGEIHRRAAQWAEASRFLTRAEEQAARVGSPFWQAEAVDRQRKVAVGTEDPRQALRHLDRCASLFQEAGDPAGEAAALAQERTLWSSLGEVEKAQSTTDRELALRREIGDRSREASVLVDRGLLFQQTARYEEADAAYANALELLKGSPAAALRARAFHERGVLYRSLGNQDRAREYLGMAIKIYRQGTEPASRPNLARSQHQLGRALVREGRLEEALPPFQEALATWKELESPRGQIVTLASLSEVLLALDRRGEARDNLEAAVALVREGPGKWIEEEARVLKIHGGVTGDPAELRAALDLYQRLGRRDGAAECQLALARIERQSGRLPAAAALLREAVDTAAALRPGSLGDDLSVSYFAGAQDFFEELVAVLMELHQREPSAGHAAAALEASERGRARGLLDLLRESEVEVDPEPALVLRQLEGRLAAAEIRLQTLAARKSSTESELAEARRAVSELNDQWSRRGREIREASPHYAALAQPRPLRVAEMRREVLDRETVILDFRLGASASYVWALTIDGLVSAVLPGRASVEEKSEWLRTKLEESFRGPAQRARAVQASCEMSRLLLAPVASALGKKRVVVVADGALNRVPFGALADPGFEGPCEGAPPLIVNHEVSSLPSASTLAVLRQERERHPRPAGAAIALADAVFCPDDPRLEAPRPEGPEGAPRRAGFSECSRRFPRLPATRPEAEALIRLVPRAEGFLALGFDATKELARSGKLAEYRYVHFATHAVAGTTRPESSYITFSQRSRVGEPVDGKLFAHELYNLKLNAELVTLSGCSTARGKEVRGEGLLGLTRGLIYAGASRVLVSLWGVEDQRTEELMTHFYQGIFERGLSPSAALRQAQARLHAAGRAPADWAAFVLVGEYR